MAIDSSVLSMADGLAGEGQASLEAYIRQLYGESGGTIGQEVAAGRLTLEQAYQMLIQAGFDPRAAEQMVRSGMMNVPLLTIPGDIETRMGPRGGQRALSGPYAIERSLAAQEVVRQAAAIKSKALMAAMQMSRAGGGGGGGGGEPPPRPPLPPIPLAKPPEKPPWYAAALPSLATAMGGIGTAALTKWMDKDPKKETTPAPGTPGTAPPSNARGPAWASPQVSPGQQGGHTQQGWDPTRSSAWPQQQQGGYQSPAGYDYGYQPPQDYGYQSPEGYDYGNWDYGYQSPGGYDYSYNPTPDQWAPPVDDWSNYSYGDY